MFIVKLAKSMCNVNLNYSRLLYVYCYYHSLLIEYCMSTVYVCAHSQPDRPLIVINYDITNIFIDNLQTLHAVVLSNNHKL